MSDETATPVPESAPEPAPTPKTKVELLLATVAARVKDSGGDVQNRVIDAMVEKEVKERSEILDRALQKRFQLLMDLKKVDKPDIILKNRDGSTQSSSWSPAKCEEIKKAQEALDKLEANITKALESNDWGKLKDAVK